MQFPEIGDPCRSNFSEAPQGEHKRIGFDAGSRVRRRVRDRRQSYTACWKVDGTGRTTLEQFHRTASGRYFSINLPGPEGLVAHNARFASGLTITPANAGRYEITATLHMVDPVILPDDQLDGAILALMGITAGGFDEPLHTFVNTEWPQLI
ncbi:hypothetical protein GCM10023116_46810 [Kistimonas scapharcae]|uniref:Uncharacterized protein n=1 Tax=Kistimonas scapharcae TaxID=1036133 RepID=A0ABP8VBQ3_9GAMM